jgi:hypothetical protein
MLWSKMPTQKNLPQELAQDGTIIKEKIRGARITKLDGVAVAREESRLA